MHIVVHGSGHSFRLVAPCRVDASATSARAFTGLGAASGPEGAAVEQTALSEAAAAAADAQ
eukprot:4516444-Pyramimonas_sp.AAC.1